MKNTIRPIFWLMSIFLQPWLNWFLISYQDTSDPWGYPSCCLPDLAYNYPKHPSPSLSWLPGNSWYHSQNLELLVLSSLSNLLKCCSISHIFLWSFQVLDKVINTFRVFGCSGVWFVFLSLSSSLYVEYLMIEVWHSRIGVNKMLVHSSIMIFSEHFTNKIIYLYILLIENWKIN